MHSPMEKSSRAAGWLVALASPLSLCRMQYLQASSFDGRHRRAVGLDWTLAIGTPTPFPLQRRPGRKTAANLAFRTCCRLFSVPCTVYRVLISAVWKHPNARKCKMRCNFPVAFSFFPALHGGNAEVEFWPF